MTLRLHRRAFLASTALAAVGGCAGATVAAWAADAGTLATGLGNLVPQLAAVVGIPTATATEITQWISAAAGVANSLSTTTTTATGQSQMQQIEGYLNEAFGALGPFLSLLPPPVGEALTAVQLLLPFIETALNMVVPPQARKPLATPPAPANLTAQQQHDWAVSILKGLPAAKS